MESIKTAIQSLNSGLLKKCQPHEMPLLAWPIVSGAAVSQKTEARHFANGVLTVSVPDRGWKTQLSELSPRYVASLNKLLPIKISRIEFEIAGEPSPSPGPTRR